MNPRSSKPRVIRITTADMALGILLKGQLGYLDQFVDIVGVCSDGPHVQVVKDREGIPVYTVEMSRQITPIKDLISLIQLVRLFRQLQPDCVHSHTPKAGILGMVAAWICQIPYRFHTVAGIPWLDIPQSPKRRLLRWVEKLTYCFATGVFPNSFGLLDRMRDERLYSCSNHVSVLGPGSSNGIDTTHFSETSELLAQATDIRQSLGICDTDFVACFVGRVVRDKGIQELLDAVSETYDRPIHLIVVGDEERSLNGISSSHQALLHSHANVHAVGFQSDVRPYILAAQVLVLPSYREGFPNVVLQALSLGRPAIVSDINGCNEIVTHKTNGWILPTISKESISQAFQSLSSQDALYDSLQSVSRDSIKPYSQQNIWQSVRSLYSETIGIQSA